jgi:hypothetical protein
MKQKNINEETMQFWKEYETSHGETVHVFCLGLYLKGYADINRSLWGLLIVTDTGFRFHHFAQEGWISALSRLTAGGGGKSPKEETAFIPKEKIISVEYREEKSLLKKIFAASPPLFILRYYNNEGKEYEFVAETNKECLSLIEILNEMIKTHGGNQ